MTIVLNTRPLQTKSKIFSIGLISVALSACGGGGGSSDSSTTPTAPVTPTTPTNPTTPTTPTTPVTSTNPTTPTTPVTPTTPITATGYAYFSDASKTQLLQYSFDANGAFSTTPSTPVYAGKNIAALKFDPAGKYAYAVSDAIYQYTVGANGVLQLASTTVVSGVTDARPLKTLAIDPTGKFIYVGNGTAVSQYKVADNGALSLIGTLNIEVSSETSLDPSGRHFYVMGTSSSVAGTIGTTKTTNKLVQYAIGSDGIIASKALTTIQLPDGDIGNLVIDPRGNYASLTRCQNYQCSAIKYNTSFDGTLGTQSSTLALTGTNSVKMVIDKTGTYAYVLNNSTTQSLSSYLISLQGVYSLISTLPIKSTADAIIINPANKNVYAYGSSGAVVQYAIGANGAVSQASSSPDQLVTSPLYSAHLLAVR